MRPVGIGPTTFCVSCKRSTTELRAHVKVQNAKVKNKNFGIPTQVGVILTFCTVILHFDFRPVHVDFHIFQHSKICRKNKDYFAFNSYAKLKIRRKLKENTYDA